MTNISKGCGTNGTPIHANENVNRTATLEIVWQFLRKLNIEILYDSEFYFQVYTQETKSICSHKNLYIHIHSSIICNSQKKRKQPQCPTTDDK